METSTVDEVVEGGRVGKVEGSCGGRALRGGGRRVLTERIVGSESAEQLGKVGGGYCGGERSRREKGDASSSFVSPTAQT